MNWFLANDDRLNDFFSFLISQLSSCAHGANYKYCEYLCNN
jgi:hypothetical protein